MLTLADVGVPMLFVYGPVLLLALLPIAGVEAWWMRRRLRERWWRVFGATVVANLFSTFVGVPLCWVALVVLQLVTGGGSAYGVNVLAVTWQAPWLIPYEEHLRWMVPTAAIVLTVPFWWVSAVCETSVMRRMLPDSPERELKRACWQANGISYLLLTGFWFVRLVMGITMSTR